MRYLIDYEKLERKYNVFTKNFEYFYPIKANFSDEVVETLIKLGSCFEVDDFYLAEKLILKYLVSPCRILYVISFERFDNEIQKIQDLGVKFYSIDSTEIMKKIIIPDAQILIRLNVTNFVNNNRFIEKWGIEEDECKGFIDEINRNNHHFSGFHFNLPSEFYTLDILKNMIQIIVEKYCSIIEYIDIGGGLKIEDCDEIQQFIIDLNYKGKIICESGYNFINDVISIEVKVLDIRRIRNENYIFIDMGIYNGLLDIIIKNRYFEIKDSINYENIKKVKYKILGPSFDISDYIGEYELTPKKINDTLIIINCGAYVSSLNTKFYQNK